MEQIVASAIMFYPKDSEYPQIVCGKRHCDCFDWMFKHQVEYDKTTYEQGFLTNNSIFLDRYKAAELAWNNGQMLPYSDTYQKIKRNILKNGICNHAYPLFSEDIW